MVKKYFGTDGIRGTVGVFPITADFMLKIGWAAGTVFKQHSKGKKKRVLIGKDTRVSGYMFESSLEAGLIAAGIDVFMLGPMPTPAIAYLTRAFRASAGIVISASHNSFEDNGIKFFSSEGYKLPDTVEAEIEKLIDTPVVTNSASELGKAVRINDATGRYVEFCKASFPQGLNLSPYRVVVDCANGATYNAARKVFKELGASVTSIAIEPNGFNINESCGSTHMANVCEKVKEEKADFGIAFDGDGDRVLFCDENGSVVDGDDLLYLIAKDYHFHSRCDGVVGTVMTNAGIELALQDLGIPFFRSKVGDRHVIEMMKLKGCKFGGESSGHIVCSDLNTTGDGIISALQVVSAVVKSGKKLSSLVSEIKKIPQVMENVKVPKSFVFDPKVMQEAVENSERALGTLGRILVRPSGTEPVIRIMAEGRDENIVRGEVDKLSELLKSSQ